MIPLPTQPAVIRLHAVFGPADHPAYDTQRDRSGNAGPHLAQAPVRPALAIVTAGRAGPDTPRHILDALLAQP